MSLPNFLTSTRFLLAGLFMAVLFRSGLCFKTLALGVFVLAMLTDYWDGALARSRGQISNFGRLMDPIADKVLVLSAFVAFVQMELVPAWMVVAIMFRDFLITGFRLLMPPGKNVQAGQSGKHKTVLQFAAIIGVLLFLIVRETRYWTTAWDEEAVRVIYFSMLIVVIVTLWSGVRYAAKNWHVFENR